MARVLVIDDDPGVRESMARMLRQAGYAVQVAESGEQGLEQARGGGFDVIISDMRMPGLSGLDVLRTLREARVDASFIVMTGFGTVDSAVEAMKLGALDFVQKPFFRDELLKALRIAEQNRIAPRDMRGSWAGAMGQCQFMPSSYLNFAVDFDGDGRADIWQSRGDIFASIANYLARSGWRGDETWGREVVLPPGFDQDQVEYTRIIRSPAEWQAMGVRTAAGKALPKVNRSASLLRAGSKNYLVYGNYDALLGYNCAHAYALAVGLLSDRLD